jgi:hypothetical protein
MAETASASTTGQPLETAEVFVKKTRSPGSSAKPSAPWTTDGPRGFALRQAGLLGGFPPEQSPGAHGGQLPGWFPLRPIKPQIAFEMNMNFTLKINLSTFPPVESGVALQPRRGGLFSRRVFESRRQ